LALVVRLVARQPQIATFGIQSHPNEPQSVVVTWCSWTCSTRCTVPNTFSDAEPSRGIHIHNLKALGRIYRLGHEHALSSVFPSTTHHTHILVAHRPLYTRPHPSLHTTLGVQASHPFTVHIPLPPHHRPQHFFCFRLAYHIVLCQLFFRRHLAVSGLLFQPLHCSLGVSRCCRRAVWHC
jgi:hypothetical protein